MLKNIHLKNLALIEEADIDLEKGLNILTGETGSGKSIIIGSVNIALGSKANKGMIRTGASSAFAELTFTGCDERALEILDSMGIGHEDGTVIISRKITPDSSVSRINGENVTLTALKKLTSRLVDVHGQHDHQSLLDPAKHMEIIDSFGADEILPVKKALADELSEYKALRVKFQDFDKDEAALEREISLLEYEINEIDAAAPVPGEDIKLEESFNTLSRARKTWDNLNKIKYLFDDESSGIIARTSAAVKEIDEALRVDRDLLPFKNTLSDIDSLVKDFGHDISRRLEENGFDQEKFAEVSARLNDINRLKAKYGDTVEDILNHQEQCGKQLASYRDFEKTKNLLSARLSESKAKINGLAKDLSSKRKDAAAALKPLISENLKDLNFLNCEFDINFDTARKISKEGFDKIQFMISLNPGEPLKPLSGVASGGELSRIMLALKSALADNDSIETLVFDEIDTGISGSTAERVSKKLKALSKKHQIVCITHLPQIAAKADSHFVIEKEVEGGSTISGIRLLDENDSVRELAKMISGSEVTAAALEHARELKNSDSLYK